MVMPSSKNFSPRQQLLEVKEAGRHNTEAASVTQLQAGITIIQLGSQPNHMPRNIYVITGTDKDHVTLQKSYIL